MLTLGLEVVDMIEGDDKHALLKTDVLIVLFKLQRCQNGLIGT